MPEYMKAMIYVLAVALPALAVAKKIAVPLIGEDEFNRWRNCWIAATCAAFLSSSFLMFAIIIFVMSCYIHRHANQPMFFYLILMFTAPCVTTRVGIPGLFNSVVELSPPRLLALLILVPIAGKLLRDPENRQLGFLDLCIGAFFALNCALSFRYGDINSVLRNILQNLLVILIPYFVFSRQIRSTKDVNTALLAFAVAAMPLAAVGVFEIVKGWRVYNQIVQQWDIVLMVPFLVRDNLLRAATTSVEPISFGFLCMVGAGCLMALKSRSKWTYVGLAILLAGLLSSLSRGPWLGFVLFASLALIVRPRAAVKVILYGIPVAGAAAFLLPAAALDRFVNLLPFVGAADPGSETYRSELLANAIVVIERYPFFGSLTFLEEPEMQKMMQGQGIIDVVNSYLQIALEYGLIGLFLFLTYFLSLGAYVFTKAIGSDKNTQVNYACLFAILMSTLFTIATTSSVSVIPYIYWGFAGICASLSRIRDEITQNSSIEARAKMRVLRVA